MVSSLIAKGQENCPLSRANRTLLKFKVPHTSRAFHEP